MLNSIKLELTKPYNEQLEQYSMLKSSFNDLEKTILNDKSEDEYKTKLEEIKTKYKKPNADQIKEVNDSINNLNKEFKSKLDNFNDMYKEYQETKGKLAKFNILLLNSKIEKINTAEKLEDLGMDIEKARAFCEEHGINFVVDLDTM